MFKSDPGGSDGILYDRVKRKGYRTEHVIVLPNRSEADDPEEAILKQIEHKRAKGTAYASGKMLVVFVYSPGASLFPNRLAQRLPQPIHFSHVWVVGLQRADSGQHSYSVALLDLKHGDAPTCRVQIGRDFDAWRVERLQ
jgi:hypothetical protein